MMVEHHTRWSRYAGVLVAPRSVRRPPPQEARPQGGARCGRDDYTQRPGTFATATTSGSSSVSRTHVARRRAQKRDLVAAKADKYGDANRRRQAGALAVLVAFDGDPRKRSARPPSEVSDEERCGLREGSAGQGTGDPSPLVTSGCDNSSASTRT